LRLEGFMEGFSLISLRLKEMYQMITMGGNAELELVDSLDPFSEGILFSVMPPKKSWKNIGNLSGGEKTLSSLALVFALHHYKPTPLYVMDEIDAALDFRNVSIVAAYIKERTKNAQFIVISLRNNMFELASRLVGVEWNDGEDARVMPYQLSSPCCLAVLFLFLSSNMECRSDMGLWLSAVQSYPDAVTPSRRWVFFLEFFLPSRARGFPIRQEQRAHTANPSISIPAVIPALARFRRYLIRPYLS
ncbi:hypothetical protein KC341_g17961, partial [Hortaea werneckii]